MRNVRAAIGVALLGTWLAAPALADFSVSVTVGPAPGSYNHYRFTPTPVTPATGQRWNHPPVIIIIPPARPAYPVVAPVEAYCWSRSNDLQIKVPGRSYVCSR